MDKYSISQKPTGKKAPKKKAKAAKRRQGMSIDPQLIIICVLIIVGLLFGGVVWARYFNKPEPVPVADSGATAGQKVGTSTVVQGQVFDGITNAIGNKKPADLNKYYAARVKVVIPKRNINKTLSASEVEAIISNPLNTAQTPWDWQISPEQLAAWQQGPYGEYLVGPVIVGISPDNTVIIIHLDETGRIDSVVIVPANELNPPPAAPPATTTPETPAPEPTTPQVPVGPFSTDVSD